MYVGRESRERVGAVWLERERAGERERGGESRRSERVGERADGERERGR